MQDRPEEITAERKEEASSSSATVIATAVAARAEAAAESKQQGVDNSSEDESESSDFYPSDSDDENNRGASGRPAKTEKVEVKIYPNANPSWLVIGIIGNQTKLDCDKVFQSLNNKTSECSYSVIHVHVRPYVILSATLLKAILDFMLLRNIREISFNCTYLSGKALNLFLQFMKQNPTFLTAIYFEKIDQESPPSNRFGDKIAEIIRQGTLSKFSLKSQSLLFDNRGYWPFTGENFFSAIAESSSLRHVDFDGVYNLESQSFNKVLTSSNLTRLSLNIVPTIADEMVDILNTCNVPELFLELYGVSDEEYDEYDFDEKELKISQSRLKHLYFNFYGMYFWEPKEVESDSILVSLCQWLAVNPQIEMFEFKANETDEGDKGFDEKLFLRITNILKRYQTLQGLAIHGIWRVSSFDTILLDLIRSLPNLKYLLVARELPGIEEVIREKRSLLYAETKNGPPPLIEKRFNHDVAARAAAICIAGYRANTSSQDLKPHPFIGCILQPDIFASILSFARDRVFMVGDMSKKVEAQTVVQHKSWQARIGNFAGTLFVRNQIEEEIARKMTIDSKPSSGITVEKEKPSLKRKF